MSGFTFAVGNLAKVASLPLYGAGALASWFVPRDDSLWVVGCGTGLAEGPLAVARAASAVPARRVVWLASDADEASAARTRGLIAFRKRSWRGFWTTMRARVLVITHGFGDVNR
ncbi:MAG: glycosyl/glycerophosphate transferase, partial [Nocardioidaceae bacterium]|nr:glycosyl/glycerophosphate transferase [Nocardioidaceae bacterium]